MSRILTLEEYLERFVEENTEPSTNGEMLVVTDQQAQNLGFFFLHGLAGVIECARQTHSSTDAAEDTMASDVADDVVN
jgi:hypothetical protein